MERGLALQRLSPIAKYLSFYVITTSHPPSVDFLCVRGGSSSQVAPLGLEYKPNCCNGWLTIDMELHGVLV